MNYLIQCFAFVFHQLRRVRINRSLVVRENKSRQFFLRWSLLSLCKTFSLFFFSPIKYLPDVESNSDVAEVNVNHRSKAYIRTYLKWKDENGV